MTKTLLKMIKPALEVTGLSDDDLLASLNAVHDAMVNNPLYPNLPADMAGFKAAIEAYKAAVSAAARGEKPAVLERDKLRGDALGLLRRLGLCLDPTCGDPAHANALPQGNPFVDTDAALSTNDKRGPSVRVPPLACSTKNRRRYQRSRRTKDEIRRLLKLPPSQWPGEARNLCSEGLVCLARLTHDCDRDVCGKLLIELRKRIRRHSRGFCREMDLYDKQEFVSEVDIQVIELVLDKEKSRKGDALEVAFGQTVKRLARDYFEKFHNSTAGNIFTEFTAGGKEDDWDEEEAEWPMEFVTDVSSDPENILLNLDDQKHRHRLLRKALKAVEDPRYREAVVLRYGYDMPIESSQRGRKCLTRYFRKDARQIKHWLATAMKQMRAALGVKPALAGNLA